MVALQRQHVVVLPVGPVATDLLQWLRDHLAHHLACIVSLGHGTPLPGQSYSRDRRQYPGAKVIETLRALPCAGADRLLGITEADCYAPGLDYIFGQARFHGREAFVALSRLHAVALGQPASRALFRQRALKEAVHELGHTWGLRHCSDPRCIMHFSNQLADTDLKEAAYCARCQTRLGAAAA